MTRPQTPEGGAVHTPGPWRYTPWHIEEGNPTVRAPEGWLICETSSDANARLIAAAPDLLAALQQAHMALIGYLPAHRNDITGAAIAAARDAIDKAQQP